VGLDYRFVLEAFVWLIRQLLLLRMDSARRDAWRLRRLLD
jgi:hypothetical protein